MDVSLEFCVTGEGFTGAQHRWQTGVRNNLTYRPPADSVRKTEQPAGFVVDNRDLAVAIDGNDTLANAVQPVSELRAQNLKKRYRSRVVVKDVSLHVRSGEVIGLLGPNGAGKTTTIKLLLNLLKTQEGSIHIFEQELQSNRIKILSQIGSLIEQPAIYLHLTGKENLLNRALLLQIPEKRVDEMLDILKIDPQRWDNPVATLSGGQLTIAAGAGPIGPAYSPTSLSVQVTPN